MPRRSHSVHPLSGSLTGRTSTTRRGIYGADGWARLDRVQELGDYSGDPTRGHTGCVNALSWSEDGGTLLSGSDDKKICIWTPDLDPDSEAAQRSPHPFKLSQVIATGHRANIFSARYLPNANTPTIVSCAGDGDIRVFEVERLSPWETFANHLRGVSGPGVTVIRCHQSRTKRIATQGAPNLFLSVSEDGTVRQHDLRRPHQCGSGCPEPLFSAPPGVELYSLSLSPLTPHLFAVAGQTDCAYVCDRRMMARQTSWDPNTSAASQVRCIRRLGLPESEWQHVGSRRHARLDRHITCVKMSADNADEVICAFAMHSTSLFSLSEDPAESSARVQNGSVIPPNSGSNTSKAQCKRSVKDSKRRLSGESQNPRPASRSRTADVQEDTAGGNADQFLRRSASLPGSEAEEQTLPPQPNAGHMDAVIANMRSDRFGMVEDFESMLCEYDLDPSVLEDGPSREISAETAAASAAADTPQAATLSTSSAPTRRHIPEWDVDSDDEEMDLSEYFARERRDSAEDAAALSALQQAQQEGTLSEWANQHVRSRGLAEPLDGAAEDYSDGDSDDEDMDEDDEFDPGEPDTVCFHGGALSKDSQFRNVDLLYPTRMFKGARNRDTVKDCNFLGDASDKVCSGSDDGMFFVWDKKSGRLQGIWEGNDEVVNVMEQHPSLPIVAVSGIDNTAKIFTPVSISPRPSYMRTAQSADIIERNSYRADFRRGATQPTAFDMLSRIYGQPGGALPEGLVELVQVLRGEAPGQREEEAEVLPPDCPLQ